eukprot:m51a1_g3962 hypothetical protein (394) ;mRNA; f:375335-376759
MQLRRSVLAPMVACLVLHVCVAVPLLLWHRESASAEVLPDPWAPVRRVGRQGPPRAETWPRGAMAAFSVSFDDGYDAMMTSAPRLMREHGVRGTFFVSSQVLDEKPFRWEQLRSLHADGNEVGTHGTRHVREPKLSRSALDRDLRAVRSRLSKFLNKSDETEAWTHAYPYGDNTRVTQDVASDVVLAGRSCPQSDCQIERADPLNPMLLRACLCSWCSASWVLSNARRAVNTNGWMIFVGHGLVSCGEGFAHGECVKGYRPQTLDEFGSMLEGLAQMQSERTVWVAPIIEVLAYGAARRATSVAWEYSDNSSAVAVTVATATEGLPGGAMAARALTYSVPLPAGMANVSSTEPPGLRTEVVPSEDGTHRVLFSLPVSSEAQRVRLVFGQQSTE